MEKKFVTLTKEQFEFVLATIDSDFETIEEEKCEEFVYDVATGIEDIAIRIFSTVDKRTGSTRGKGKDAIRIVHWNKNTDRPIGKGKKILRTDGRTSIGDRITNRIAEFQKTAKDLKIKHIDWDYVREILENASQYSHFAASLLGNLIDSGSLSETQLSYILGEKNPKGRNTFEANYRKHNGGSAKSADSARIELNQARAARPQESRPMQRPKITADFDPILADKQDSFPTAEYPYYRYPFEFFNPVQTATLPHIKDDTNLVIGANTSAGKTICAELLMDRTLRDRSPKRLNRVIYLSPLKSLTQEKYDDWSKRYADKTITILTGDYTLSQEMKNRLAESDIIVMTSEMTDSRTRKMNSERNFWLKEVGLIIVDESHILSTDRGHAVESGLMRFTRINPNARVLLLSATMPNCRELADWLTKMNGKHSDVIFNTWRPVKLKMNYIGHPVVYGRGDRPDYQRTQEEKRRLAIDIVMGNHSDAEGKENEKFLVFCHDKGTGHAIVKRLREHYNVNAYFHNADLDMSDRLEIEGKFADRSNGIRVLVSTSTLAWGRNLPARNVIIVGVHRGIREVDELDIIQMAGRAGRYGIDDKGTVYLLCPQGTEKAWEHTFHNPRPVRSGFLSADTGMVGKALNLPVMAFHLLSEVENKAINNGADVMRWFSRSLAIHQVPECLNENDSHFLLSDLQDMEMLTYTGNYINPTITGLGKVSAWLYYSPYDVHKWYRNFDTILKKESYDDMALCWALCDIPSNDMGYIPKELGSIALHWQWKLRNQGILASDAVCSAIAAHYCITGQKTEGALSPLARNVKYDIRRIVEALRLIDSQHAKWEQPVLWKAMVPRINYGINLEMVELVQLHGVGGVTAKKMYENGLRSLADIALKQNLKVLMKFATPQRAKQWMAEAGSIIKQQ